MDGGALILAVGTILYVSIMWTNPRGAPWWPTSMKTVHKMLTLADVKPGDVVYDLGCGDGRTLVAAARHYGAQAVGIELDPLRYVWCQMLITILGLRGRRVSIVYGDFFGHDLSDADVVTCFLLQTTNNKLIGKFRDELQPGARVVSNTFTFSGIEPVCEDGKARLYVF